MSINPSVTAIKMSQIIHSDHVNKEQTLSGGQLLKWVDICACLSAEKLAGHPCVTVSLDDLYFTQHAKLGQVLNLQAQVNRAFRTSMEVGVKVICEDLYLKTSFFLCEAFFTFVALGENGSKVQLPQIVCENNDEKLAHSLANERRKVRISYSQSLKSLLKNTQLLSVSTAPPSPSIRTSSTPSINVIDGDKTMVESVELVLPPHANHHGNTFGGQIMAWMENVASISAGYLFPKGSILRSVDMVWFRQPSSVGDRIVLKSIVNNVFKDSFEVGVRVEAYRYENGRICERRHINSAFLTYDVISTSQYLLPIFVPAREDGERRAKEAAARRKMRLDRKYVLHGTEKDSPSVVWSPSRSIFIRYSNVQELIKLEACPSWKLVADKDGVLLSTHDREGILSFRASIKLDVNQLDAEKVFSVVKGMERRKEWDPIMISWEVLERVSSEDTICRTVMRSGSLKTPTPNEFLLLVSDRRPASFNDPYRVAMRSVSMNDHPPGKQNNRMEVACAGFVIKQKKGICTEISYYNETNPQLVTYILHDVAGLSNLYAQVVHSLLNYVISRSRQVT